MKQTDLAKKYDTRLLFLNFLRLLLKRFKEWVIFLPKPI